MIEIRDLNGVPYIVSSVADFCDSMGYCEYKIKHYLKGIRPPQTTITIDETKAHEQQEQYEKEHFEFVPISKEELADSTRDVEFAYESIYTRLLTPLAFGEDKILMLIFGRADKVYRNNETLIVEESKFPSNREKYSQSYEPYPDQKLQTLLYLNSAFTGESSFNPEDWFEIPHKSKAWIIKIKDRSNSEDIKIFKGSQTKEAADFLMHNLQRFALIALGKVEPKHHKNIRKCIPCRFKECEYML
jgi:hypothetical protein